MYRQEEIWGGNFLDFNLSRRINHYAKDKNWHGSFPSVFLLSFIKAPRWDFDFHRKDKLSDGTTNETHPDFAWGKSGKRGKDLPPARCLTCCGILLEGRIAVGGRLRWGFGGPSGSLTGGVRDESPDGRIGSFWGSSRYACVNPRRMA